VKIRLARLLQQPDPPAVKWSGSWRATGVLALFAAFFFGLNVYSYTRTSATYDEPINLTSGYVMLKYHDFRFSPDHVPFLRMWAALPLAFSPRLSFDTNVLQNVDLTGWVLQRHLAVAEHDFLYRLNDADRLRYSARFMMTLLGVLLGILVFSWARELFGFGPAVVALCLYTLEPNTLAHSCLITADSGLGCFVFGAAYFLWRTARCLSPGNLSGLSLFTALALASKFWGLLLLLIIPLCLLIRVADPTPWPCRIRGVRDLVSPVVKIQAALIVFLVVLALGCFGIWSAYDFHYRPAPAPADTFHFDQTDYVLKRVPQLAGLIRRLDRTRLLPNAYTQGFLYGCATLRDRKCYLNGNIKRGGCWYYFPEAFLIKTPVTLLLLLVAGTALWWVRWRTSWRDAVFLFLPPSIFFAVVMWGSINIGLRYVLLVYPFVALIATRVIVECLKSRRLSWAAPAAVLLAATELSLVYPHCLSCFNCLAGGPDRGYYYLVDSNLDWGQDLKGLKPWMDRHGIDHINLSYFGSADPAYYHINQTCLLDPPYAEGLAQPARLPGYVAMSATCLVTCPPLLQQKPVAVIGHSIYIFWVDDK